MLAILISKMWYRSTRSFTLFFALWYFSLFKLKVISNRLPWFSFLSPFHSKFTKTGCYFHSRIYFPPIFYPLQEVQYFLIRSPWSDHLDPISHSFVYIKHHLPINKQFSIDSFLDWEGLHWDLAYLYRTFVRLRFRTTSALTPTASNTLALFTFTWI